MPNAYEWLRRNLESAMANRGWNRSELARRSGLGPAYVTQILNGTNRNPGLDQIEALAKGLGTTASRLLAGPEDKPNAWDAIDEAIHLYQELREKGPDSPEIRALFRRPPKK